MKSYLYLIIGFLFSLSVAKAQKPVSLTEDSVKFGSRYFPGFWLTIPEAKPEIVKTNWIKTIQKGTKSKVSIDRNEMTLFGAIIRNVTDGSINIMSRIDNADSLILLFVSVETARDIYIGKTSEEYEKLSAFLNKFGKDQYINIAKEQLSAEESKLKTLEKKLKSDRKNKLKFEKSIQSAKVNITQQNDKISGFNKELEILDISIDNASTLLSTMLDGDAKKSKKSELKDLQKKKKTLLKNINSAENSISKSDTSISDNTKNIEMNDDTQKEMTVKINKQKLSVARFQQKLKAIEAY